MKKIVTGSLFILALTLSNNQLFAQSNAVTTTAQSKQEWTFIESQKNVEISFSKINVNGTFYLAIQLENKSTQEVALTWTVAKNAKQLFSGTPKAMSSGSKITLLDATQPIVIGEHESYEAFSVEIR